MAMHNGHSLGKLSFEEFQEAMVLVKPNVATGRDNVPGTILLFLLGTTKVLLYNAVVERLARSEDTHVEDWAEFAQPMAFDLPGCHAVQTVRIVRVESSGQENLVLSLARTAVPRHRLFLG